MAKIAALIADMFEDKEYWEPAIAFQAAGHEVVNVGLKQGAAVKGKKEKMTVKIDRAVRDVGVDDFDALFIPGGYSPDHLRIDADAVAFARDFVKSGKPVLSICHAPQLLVTADVLKGRKLTGYVSIIEDIKNAGAQFVDRSVVEDGNLISSRNPGDIPPFIEASLDLLEKVYGKQPAGVR